MSKLQMRRFETSALKSASTTDPTQVPASAAVLDVYKQGASVSADTTVTTSSTAVAVYDVGALIAGDLVQVDADSTSLMTIVSVDSAIQIHAASTTGSPIALEVRNRLVPVTNRPTLYQDSVGSVAFVPSYQIQLDTTGYGYFYVSDRYFDYIISGSGIVSALFIDGESGWARGNTAWVNVRDYPTFQAAINALPDEGGVVYIPAGTYTRDTVPAVVPMTIDRPVKLLGDGSSPIGGGGTHVAYTTSGTPDTTNHLITVDSHDADWFRAEGIFFQGAGSSGSGSAIYMKTVYDVIVRDCTFYSFPSWAVQSGTGVDTTDDVVNCLFEHCIFDGSKSNGLLQLGNGGANCFFIKFFDCNFIPIVGRAAHIVNGQHTVFDACTFQTSMADAASSELLFVDYSGGLNKLIVNNCWFENNTNGVVTPTSWFIGIDGPSANASIRDTYFARAGTATTSLRAIQLVSTLNLNVHISDCLGDLGNRTTSGTDDLVIGSSSGVVMTNCSIRDTNAYDNPWQISGAGAANLVRLGDGFGRVKVRGLPQTGVAPAAAISTLTDINVGDMIYNTDNTSLNIRNANGWQHVGLFVKATAGPPSSGAWTIGDMCLNTNDNRIYVCTASGTSGTWRYVATTVYP